MATQAQIDKDFQTFQEMTPEFHAYFSEHSVRAIFALVEDRLEQTGRLSSVSEFIRAFEELKKAGLPKLRRSLPKPEPEEKVFTLTAAEYRQMPYRVLQLKYQNQPEFRAAVQSLIDRGLI